MGYILKSRNITSIDTIKEWFIEGNQITYKLNDVEFTETVYTGSPSVTSSSGSSASTAVIYYIGNLDLATEDLGEEVGNSFEDDHLIACYIHPIKSTTLLSDNEEEEEEDKCIIIGGDLDNLNSIKFYNLVSEAHEESTYVKDKTAIEPKLKESYLPENVMTEDEEGLIISKALNDLNQRIIDIDVTEQLEKVKEEIEENNIWILNENNNSLRTRNANSSSTGISIGNTSKSLTRGIAIGNNSLAFNTEGIAIGYDSRAGDVNCISIGPESHAGGVSAIAIGANSIGKLAGCIAIGESANADQFNGIVIGRGSKTSNQGEIALGVYNKSISGHTHFSIAHPNSPGTGISNKNIFEISRDGKVYIFGIGGFDGQYTEDDKSLQEVLEDTNYVTASALADLDNRINNISLSWNII